MLPYPWMIMKANYGEVSQRVLLGSELACQKARRDANLAFPSIATAHAGHPATLHRVCPVQQPTTFVCHRIKTVARALKRQAHSTAKCNGQSFGVEENLTRSSVAEYLSGTRVEFVLDPLDLGIRHNREIRTFWEVLSE